MWKLENSHDKFRDIRCRLLDLFIASQKNSPVSVDGCEHPGIHVATYSRTVCILIYYRALNTYTHTHTHTQHICKKKKDYTIFFVPYIQCLMVLRNVCHVLWYLWSSGSALRPMSCLWEHSNKPSAFMEDRHNKHYSRTWGRIWHFHMSPTHFPYIVYTVTTCVSLSAPRQNIMQLKKLSHCRA
jgi:hypothetical protein